MRRLLNLSISNANKLILSNNSSSNTIKSFSTSAYPHHEHSKYLPAALLKSSSMIPAYAKGSWITDINNKKYLDFTCGIGVTNLGHCHPVIAETVHKQIDLGIHLQQNCMTSKPMLE